MTWRTSQITGISSCEGSRSFEKENPDSEILKSDGALPGPLPCWKQSSFYDFSLTLTVCPTRTRMTQA